MASPSPIIRMASPSPIIRMASLLANNPDGIPLAIEGEGSGERVWLGAR